jgi:carboxymethylenebutenolidase
MQTQQQQASNEVLHIPQVAFDWYDEYAHGDIDRRTFLARLGTLGIAGLTLGAMTAALTPNYALAHQVDFTDPDIKGTYVKFDSPMGHGEGRGYLVVPTGVDEMNEAPTVLVAHENRGLNPYIEDVARRLAKAGFIAFAPDALYPLGGYPGNDDDGRAMQKTLDRGKIEQDFIAASKMLKNHSFSNGKLGMVGFCFGGYLVNKLAVDLGADLNAGVPFYGTPASEGFENITAPLVIQFAELDKRVNATWPEYQAVLDKLGKSYTAHVYPQTNHGFHNDSTGRYDEAAAELAWSRTVEFFKAELA